MTLDRNIVGFPNDSARGDGARPGQTRSVFDSNGKERKDIYVYTAGALSAAQPYMLTRNGTEAQDWTVVAPATLANAFIVAPTAVVTAAGYTWVTYEGPCAAAMNIGSTTAVDTDLLKVANAGTGWVVDGTSGSSAFSANTCGAMVGASAAGVANITLFGRQIDI